MSDLTQGTRWRHVTSLPLRSGPAARAPSVAWHGGSTHEGAEGPEPRA